MIKYKEVLDELLFTTNMMQSNYAKLPASNIM
jgi:hypothetical protein